MPSSRETKWKKFFWSRWFLLATAVLLFLVIFAFGRAYYRDYQVRQEINHLQAQVDQLEVKKIEVDKYLEYAKSKDFVEQKARTELNLVKEGEQAVIIGGGSSSTNITGQEVAKMIESKQLSNPLKWWKFFTQAP